MLSKRLIIAIVATALGIYQTQSFAQVGQDRSGQNVIGHDQAVQAYLSDGNNQTGTTSIVSEVLAEEDEDKSSSFFTGNGIDIQIGNNASVKVGAGLRTSLNFVEDDSPNESRWSSDFNLDNLRLYISGNVVEYLGFEFNTDINNANGFDDPDDIRVLDAVGKLEVNDLVNLWFGRFLPPSDRSNLSGPFYLNAYEFPYVQFGYPGILQGRDDGAAIWGQVGEGAFKWQVGMFKGTDGFPNGDDHRMLTARLTLNLLDPEPGYYNQSTYYGEKDILAIGVAMMNQNDATGTISDPKDYLGWNIDVLFEKKLDSDGVLSLETAYYDFDDHGADQMEIAAGDLVDMNRQGESFFILAAYLFPEQVALGNIEGQFQPYFRFMDFDRDFPSNGETEEGIDLGLNYIIDGHNAQISVVYGRREPGPGAGNYDLVRIGAQLQF